ncbi:site-specific integrase [Methylosinus sp. H3A]|nr:site-specific integrase [Methylosinus sp. H3A]
MLRIEVPKDVQEFFGRKVVRESLGTRVDREARQRAARRKAQLFDEWEEIRRRRHATLEDHVRIAAELYQGEMEADRLRRADLPDGDAIEIERQKLITSVDAAPDQKLFAEDPEYANYLEKMRKDARSDPVAALAAGLDYLVARDAAKLDRDRRKHLLATLQKHLASGETALVRDRVDAALREHRLLIKRGTREYRQLCQSVMRAWIEQLKQAHLRDEGDWSGRPADEIVKPSGRPATPAAAPGETIMERFEAFAQANPHNVKLDTLNYSRKCIELFAQSLPRGYPASAIDKKSVREWHDLLRQFPVKAAEAKEFRGKTIRAVVQANAVYGKPTISRRTQNKYLAALGSFCRWLDKRGYIDGNPVSGMQDVIDKDAQPVRSYSIEELRAIFSSPIFTGCESDEKDYLPGEVQTRDWRFWLPTIALFTGARLGELSQLLVDDLREIEGRWVFHVTQEGDPEKSVKTKGSRRIIPVHGELIRIGILKYHVAMKERSERRLFPEITANTRGQISGTPSRWYGRYLRRIGLKDGKETNFHSFRHTVADAFRRAGYLDAEFGFILGHTRRETGTTRRYGVRDCQESCVWGHSRTAGGGLWRSRRAHWTNCCRDAIRRRFFPRMACSMS